MTVILSDLAGSTAMQEALDPESVRRVMARYYEVMRAAVARHEGRIEKFIGDAVVAVFGTPTVREDDAVRAVRCAAAMVAALERLNDELERHWGVRLALRTGVNTGELVISGEGILVGDTMNTAARLEQSAPAGEVLIGEATWRLVRNQVSLEELEPLALKGKAAPVRAWRLMAADGSPTGAQDAPLVGRAAELRRLHAVLDAAVAERTCRLVSVVGSPGLGKSRLAEEFAREVSERAQVLRGHCEPSGEGNAFLPVAEVIREVAGIAEADSFDIAREKLRTLAPAEDPDRERLVERVAGVLGIGEPASAQETFWALRRGLEDLARRRPLVLVLDDLHWAQPMLLDLLEHLIEWIRDAPALIVVLARPELREAREVLTAVGRRASDVIELEPLDAGESRALVDGLLGVAELPGGLLKRMLETTEGNPLFLGELVRMLVDERALVRSGDGWAVREQAEAFDVPPTIQALLSARIERLRDDERAVVERAAVIGQQFYRGAVAELVAPPVRAGIDGHLAALRRKELVEPEGVYWIDEPVYRFHHVLIRDAAYRLLLKEARAVLHERFADWLAAKAGELVGEYEEMVAFHLEQAHAYRRELGPLDDAGRALGARAAAHLLSAGRRALAREDLAAAENLLMRALACEGGADEDILWDLAEALLSAGDAAQATDVVERYATAVGEDERGRARAAVIAGQLANLTGGGDAIATADAAARAATQLRAFGDGQGEAKAWAVVAQTNARLGRVAVVETALDHALTAARSVEDRRRTTAVLAAAPRAALWGPSTVVRASGRCLDVVRILRMTPGNRHVEAVALRCQAVLEAMRGRPDAARDILAGARTTLEELGLSLELNETRTHAAMVELLDGQPGQAVEQLRGALAGFASLGADAAAAHAAALLARALVVRGEPGDAEAALVEVAFAEQHGGEDLRTAIIAMSAQGEALAQTGHIEEAIASARQAVELAEPTDALSDKADASMTLARVLLAAGRRDEALAAAQAASASYEAKGHTVGLGLAARLAGGASEPVVAVPSATSTGVDVLGERQSERVVAEFTRCYNERDFDAMARVLADDCYWIDHRRMGWEEVRGREQYMAFVRSALPSPNLRYQIDEVIAADDRVLVSRSSWGGRGVKAGQLELRIGAVTLTENGRLLGVESYEPEDLDAMLARFAELSRQHDDHPAVTATERFWADYMRLTRERNYEAIERMLAPDCTWFDHRAIAWEPARGREQVMDVMRSVFDAAPEVRADLEEILASDEHVIAARVSWHGPGNKAGAWRVEAGAVHVLRDGMWASTDFYEPADRQAIVARYAELGGGLSALRDSPAERVARRFLRHYAAHELGPMLDLTADDFRWIDHRSLNWEPILGRDGISKLMQSSWEGTLDIRIEVDEVLACDGLRLAMLFRWIGHNARGGAFELPAGDVIVTDGERYLSIDQYDYADREAMLARFAELAGERAERGRRQPELLAAEEERRYNAHDLDGFLELFAPHYALVDHRSIGWGELSRDGLCEGTEAAFRSAPDIRKEVEEVLACDEHVIAARIAYHGEGRTAGPWRLEAGSVSILEDGVWARSELFERDDRQRMVARYVELGGGLSALGESPVERFAAEFYTRQARGELEPVQELIDERYVHVDHRVLGWDEARGLEGHAALHASLWKGNRDVHVEVDEVLAASERVLAMRIRWVGHGSRAGAFEIPVGQVVLTEQGRLASVDQYDPGDRESMLARFAELNGGTAAAAHPREPERLLAEYGRRLALRDVEAIVELFDAGYRMHDHRPTVSSDARQGAGTRADLESTLSISPDIRFEIEEVLACDDRVIAARIAYRGHAADGGGEFEVEFGWVVATEDGLGCMSDIYEPDDRQAMIARYVELGGGLSVLGDKEPERILAEFCRRYARRDLEQMMEMITPDFTWIDHRALSWEPFDRDGMRAVTLSGWQEAVDIRIEVDEVLAVDDFVIAVRLRFVGTGMSAGPSELPVGQVCRYENGLGVSLDQYDYDDREGMLARFAELGGRRQVLGDRPPERLLTKFLARLYERDYEGFSTFVAEDWHWTDHRAVGWEESRGREACVAVMRSLYEAAPNVRLEFDEVLAVDDRVLAVRMAWRGRGLKAGDFEVEAGAVYEFDNGLWAGVNFFEPADRQAIVARYTELGGGLSALGDSPLEHLWAEFCRCFARTDIVGLLELVSEQYVLVDHRPIGWAPTRGHEGFRELQLTTWAAGDVRIEVDEVLAVGDRAMALLVRWTGHGAADMGGGEFSVQLGRVTQVIDGRIVRVEQFEPEDREAMLRCFAELNSAGPVALGDRPPERWQAEYSRRWAARDVEGLVKLTADDWVLTDRRSVAVYGQMRGLQAARDTVTSSLDGVRDPRFTVHEVLACDETRMAAVVSWSGVGYKGAVFSNEMGMVLVLRDGLQVIVDLYEADDRESMLARFAELGGRLDG